jgi:hypothetical protein
MASLTESKSGDVSAAKTSDEKETTIADGFKHLLLAQKQVSVALANIDLLCQEKKKKARESDTIKVVKNSIYDIKRKEKLTLVSNWHGGINAIFPDGANAYVEFDKYEFNEEKFSCEFLPDTKFEATVIGEWPNFDTLNLPKSYSKLSWQIFNVCERRMSILESDSHPIDRICIVRMKNKRYLLQPKE